MDLPPPSGNFADLRVRVLSAVVLAVLAVIAGWAGGYVWTGLVAIAAGIMGWELHGLAIGRNDRADSGLAISVITAGASVVFTHAMGAEVGLVVAVAGVLMLGVIDPKRHVRLAAGVFYISVASVGLVALRDVPEQGIYLVLWLVLVVVACDIGGYFAGRMIGGPKLWTRISPKKTWSGTIGGWVLAVAVSLAMARWMGWDIGLIALFSLLLALASQAGDLAESAVKRAAGVKDSSNLIPGHGGLLDRFDALMGASMLATVIGLAGFVT